MAPIRDRREPQIGRRACLLSVNGAELATAPMVRVAPQPDSGAVEGFAGSPRPNEGREDCAAAVAAHIAQHLVRAQELVRQRLRLLLTRWSSRLHVRLCDRALTWGRPVARCRRCAAVACSARGHSDRSQTIRVACAGIQGGMASRDRLWGDPERTAWPVRELTEAVCETGDRAALDGCTSLQARR